MFKFSNLTLFLSSKDIKKRFITLQFLFLFSSFFEVGGISLIGPLIFFTSDADQAMQNEVFLYVYSLFNLQSYEQFLILFSIFTLSFIIVGGISSFLSVIYLSKIATSSGINLSTQVFQKYLDLNWAEHLAIEKSKMINEIYQETVRVTQNIFLPILMINKSIFLSFVLVSFLFIVSWKAAISLFLLLTAIYLILFLILKQSLNSNSKILTEAHENRYKFLNDTFETMKQIHLWGNEKIFQDGFEIASNNWGNALRRNMNISLLPRYVVETMILVCVAAGVGIFFYNPNDSFTQNIPSISVFIFSAFKLLPAIQQIYSFISTITGNIYSLNNLSDLLKESKKIDVATNKKLPIFDTINLQKVSFQYPKTDFKIKDINLEFSRGEIIGITGYSGSGKSTFVDIMMGLIEPNKGKILVNGEIHNLYENKDWFKKISYLPPKIHLINSSIENNIHFSDRVEINKEKIASILHDVNLKNLVNNSDDNRANNLNFSSGQIQRLGIARAAYKEHEIIFYDEPTSALDNKNRELFIRKIQKDKEKSLIIIISHDLALLEITDKVLIFNDGEVDFFGGYDQAMENSDIMSTLAK
tara:strand:- start:3406 stop:5163 length:1758 start_codon:yes stop_codon:yes gene_type:complete